MTCASCGKQVAVGARYCVHCGAEQSVPTPIAAVAAALMSRDGAREAANAAHAEPGHRVPGRMSGAAPSDGTVPTGPFAHGSAANAGGDEPTRPAYADAPRRRGFATTFIACCVIVAIAAAGVLVWRSEVARPEASAERAASAAPADGGASSSASAPVAEATPSEMATAPETSTHAEPEPPGTQPPAGETAAAPDARNADAAAETSAPVAITPLPPHPSTPRPTRHATAAPPSTASRTPAAPPQAEPPSPPAAAVPAAPPPARARAAEAPAPHVADRWKRLDEELSRCTREDFIARVICGQRVRFRYCDGYWGKVPQCPGNPAPERGQ